METVQIKIDPCPDNNFNFQTSTRTRKVSFDHGRRINYTDINGNHGHRMLNRRKSSFDASGLLANLSVRENSISECESATDIPDWQKSLIKQIETLVVNSKQSDTLTTDLDSELQVINEGVVPEKVSSERSRSRRKSVMHVGNSSHNFLHPNRKVSHGHSSHDNVALSITGHVPHPSVNNRRRKSYANIEHHVARTQRSGSIGNLKESLPFRGRLNSVSVHGPFQIPLIRQRRKSTVKQPTFTVSKITSVQRKSYNIYRRRRRKELRHIEQVIPPQIKIENSDDDFANDNNTEYDNPGEEPNHDNSREEPNHSVDAPTEDVNSYTPDTVEDTCNINLNVEEPIPVTRRKCSIQMRYWEISRKLRQRRREKKKGNKMTENDNDEENTETATLGNDSQ